MAVPAHYLEAAKVDEVAQELRAQGYTVVQDHRAGHAQIA